MRVDGLCAADRTLIAPCGKCGKALTPATAKPAMFRGHRADEFGRKYNLCPDCAREVSTENRRNGQRARRDSEALLRDVILEAA